MKQVFSISILAICLLGFSFCKDNNQAQNEYSSTYYTDMENQLKIIAEITLKPDAAKAMRPIFEKVIAASQAEEGCIYYDLHKDVSDTTDTKYVMIETWKDQAAIDTHNETQHFKTFKQAAGDYIADMKVIVLKVSK